MNHHTHRILLALTLAGAALLAGCAVSKGSSAASQFDFGPTLAGAPAPAAPLAALLVTDATGSPALDSERMFYRLNYVDPLQAHTYANSRWSSTPLQMVTQRFKSRFAQAGVKVVTETDASNGIPILRVEIEDFTHSFDSQADSYGQLVLRASLFDGHKLVDQKTFHSKTSARSADAAGGARALATSTDAAAADLIAWLSALPLRKQ